MRQRPGKAVVRFVVTLVIVVAAAAGGAWGYRLWSAPQVLVTGVVRGPVVEAFYATGTLQPVREYPVRSNVEGIVTRVLVDKGAPVTRDGELAMVRVEEYQMRFRQALAERDLKARLARDDTSPLLAEFDARIAAAREQFAIARRELERVANLRQSAVAAPADYDRTLERVQTHWSAVESLLAQRATRQAELERDLAVAQAALDIAQWNLDQQTIRCPADGVVLDRPVPTGTRVRPNDLLMTVADVAPQALVMRAAVDEEDKTRLSLDQPVRLTLYAYPQRVFTGRVHQVYPVADEARRTFEVDVRVEPVDPAFAAGMTGELAFIVHEEDNALVLPAQAVRDGAVWVVHDRRLNRRPVTVGVRSVERVQILAGIEEDEQVVISPLEDPQPGRAVRPRHVDPRQAAMLDQAPQETPMRGFN